MSKFIIPKSFKNGVLSTTKGRCPNFRGIKSIGEYGLYEAFYGCDDMSGSVYFPELISIGEWGMMYTFYGCTGLTGGISFPELTTIGGSGYIVDNSSLGSSIINGGMYGSFSGCRNISSVLFPKLETVGGTGLADAFEGCTNLTEIHFPTTLSGNSECTTSRMGCTNATVYFDLGVAWCSWGTYYTTSETPTTSDSLYINDGNGYLDTDEYTISYVAEDYSFITVTSTDGADETLTLYRNLTDESDPRGLEL